MLIFKLIKRKKERPYSMFAGISVYYAGRKLTGFHIYTQLKSQVPSVPRLVILHNSPSAYELLTNMVPFKTDYLRSTATLVVVWAFREHICILWVSLRTSRGMATCSATWRTKMRIIRISSSGIRYGMWYCHIIESIGELLERFTGCPIW